MRKAPQISGVMTAFLPQLDVFPRFTVRDVVACLPVLGYGVVALLLWLAYRDVGQWPLFSAGNPGGPDPDLMGLRKFMLIFLPLIAAPLCVVSLAAVTLSTVSDFLDAKKMARRKIALRGLVQFAVSVLGVALFFPLLGRILVWILD